MAKKRKRQPFWTPLKILSLIGAGFVFVLGGYFSDKITTWRNAMIDEFLAKNQANILGWIFTNPLNLMISLAMLVLIFLAVDAYYFMKHPKEVKRPRQRKKELPVTTFHQERPRLASPVGFFSHSNSVIPEEDELKQIIYVGVKTFLNQFDSFRHSVTADNKYDDRKKADEIMEVLAGEHLIHAQIVLKRTEIPSALTELQKTYNRLRSDASQYAAWRNELAGYMIGGGHEEQKHELNDKMSKISQSLNFTIEKIDSLVENLLLLCLED